MLFLGCRYNQAGITNDASYNSLRNNAFDLTQSQLASDLNLESPTLTEHFNNIPDNYQYSSDKGISLNKGDTVYTYSLNSDVLLRIFTNQYGMIFTVTMYTDIGDNASENIGTLMPYIIYFLDPEVGIKTAENADNTLIAVSMGNNSALPQDWYLLESFLQLYDDRQQYSNRI